MRHGRGNPTCADRPLVQRATPAPTRRETTTGPRSASAPTRPTRRRARPVATRRSRTRRTRRRAAMSSSPPARTCAPPSVRRPTHRRSTPVASSIRPRPRRRPIPLYPLEPGTTGTYVGGGETDTVTVTNETRLIAGVTCIVVHDTVSAGGAVTEDTEDFFAQDVDGNVWYFGELSQEFENGELTSLEGSWRAGVDGASPGIIMRAMPAVGDTYRQEFAFGNAEDAAEVQSTTGSATVPATSCAGTCLVTREFTPLEPDADEQKYYAPGIGMILEVETATGVRNELVSFTGG